MSTLVMVATARAQGGFGESPGISELLDAMRSGTTTRGERGQTRGDQTQRGLRSPFGTAEPLEGELVRRELFHTFTEEELLLVEDFCSGEIEETAERLLKTLTKFSALERDFCTRARSTLLQFGYQIFDAEITPEVLVSGAIPDDYVLGIGDQLIVTFRGQESGTSTVFVDREGRVILEDMPPILAAGRTFGEFRRELEARTETVFLGTEVFVSLGSVRLVSVAVMGEVRQPGLHRLTGLSTILDAIGIAGGIKKTGSMRRIQVQRGDHVFWLDLYELLISGVLAQSLALFDGDRIFVPTIGATAAIGGQVKRPGIYELAEGRSSLSIAELVNFAGGLLRPRGNRFYRLSFSDDGREQVTEGSDTGATVADGDIVMVNRGEDVQVGSVELLGHVRVPGRRSLASAPTVRGLAADASNLRENPYLLLAVLDTTDPATRARRFFPVNLRRILAGQEDFSLRDGDRLIVLGAEDIRYLWSTDVQNVLHEVPVPGLAITEESLAGATRERVASDIETAPEDLGTLSLQQQTTLIPTSERTQASLREEFEEACAGLRTLATIVAGGEVSRFVNAMRAVDEESVIDFSNRVRCPRVFDEHVDLLPFLLEHAVAVDGEVRRPGAYPITGDTSLLSVVAVAGGVTRDADLAHVEVSRLSGEVAVGAAAAQARTVVDLRSDDAWQRAIGPGDVIRFNPKFIGRESGPVQLVGEFARPGFYQIRRGERLSEVIARAGGLTPQAYPYGAVFTRERVKKAEKEGFKRVARELNAALAARAAQEDIDSTAFDAVSKLSEQLQNIEAVGRVVTEADPTVLQVRPDLDTVLEAGDRLFMPKRPNFVSVIGDVLNPGALQFASGKRADEYISQAGSFQRSADEDRVFVVFPNGEAQPLSISVWNYTPVQIPPGSTIFVPKDPAPFDLLQFSLDMSELLSQIALAAASLAVINQ